MKLGSFVKPPKSLLRLVGRAIAEFDLIRDNDRILLGLSGGKDSLSLLHVLHHFQRHAPITFEFATVTVDYQFAGFDPSPLEAYVTALGIPHYVASEPIHQLASKHMDNNSYTAFSSRMRRGLMYKTAREYEYNVLALAQHLDDIAESFLMSVFYGGQLKTMKAHYQITAGDLRVIRPLVYVRERQTADFAQQAQLPIIDEQFPEEFSAPQQRAHMKQLLAREEIENNGLFRSLMKAMHPLLSESPADSPSKDAD